MDVDFSKLQKEIEIDEAESRRRAGRRVKDKRRAEIQVTAEQILRVAHENRERYLYRPQRRIEDKEELEDYFLSKRTDFEKMVAKNRYAMSRWLQYAKWEESMHEFERSRSIYERALDVDHTDPALWLKYAEMEIRHKFVNHARNVLDRATSLLPRVDRLWLKYVFVEEMLGNVRGARGVFERWLKWLPPPFAFRHYVDLEVRYGEFERARNVFERWVGLYPVAKSWLAYVQFERQRASQSLVEGGGGGGGDVAGGRSNIAIVNARKVFQRAIDELSLAQSEGGSQHQVDEKIFVEFAQFEEEQGEIERARVIFQFALDQGHQQSAAAASSDSVGGGGGGSGRLYRAFVAFEKKHGNRLEIEEVIVGKKRQAYETQLAAEPQNYDLWFDYIALEEKSFDRLRERGGTTTTTTSETEISPDVESAGERVRELYERAIGQVPPIQEKRYWRRYVYFWIKYALFEELKMRDLRKTYEIYRKALDLIPHDTFSFSKLWILCAKFLLRRGEVAEARKVFGTAIGKAPKEKVFEEYVKVEILLGNVGRAREIYQRFLEFDPSNADAWIQFAQLESRLGDTDRARAVYELGVQQEILDMPERVWKSYIDLEIAQERHDLARGLYRRLLEKTKHVKVWISFAEFEATVADDAVSARRIFLEADKCLRGRFTERPEEDRENLENEIDRKEQRVALLAKWKSFERQYGERAQVEVVEKKMPRRVKRKRRILGPDGEAIAGYEEYFDYVFPDDGSAEVERNRLLEIAHRWKMQQAESESDSESGSDDDDEDIDDDSSSDEGDDDDKMQVD